MQLITAVIKPHMLEGVKDALQGLGVQGMTATEVKGFGRQGGHTESYRGGEYRVDFVPKLKVEVAVDDVDGPKVIEAIRGAAQTGRIGDGKIWSVALGTIMRVRTGETDSEAI